MKFPIVVMLVASLTLVSCSGHDSTPPIFTTQILSDPVYDGDIKLGFASGTFTVTQTNTQFVLAGIDPVNLDEYRAFLDFPLGGPGGVPLNAGIASATLDIFINDIQPTTGTIPMRIDLVDFQPPWLFGSDFSVTQQPALATIYVPIYQSDYLQHVLINVTSLMREAQRLGLPDFQVRIMEDLGLVNPGIIEIDDTTGTNRALLAPLLEVSYY